MLNHDVSSRTIASSCVFYMGIQPPLYYVINNMVALCMHINNDPVHLISRISLWFDKVNDNNVINY